MNELARSVTVRTPMYVDKALGQRRFCRKDGAPLRWCGRRVLVMCRHRLVPVRSSKEDLMMTFAAFAIETPEDDMPDVPNVHDIDPDEFEFEDWVPEG